MHALARFAGTRSSSRRTLALAFALLAVAAPRAFALSSPIPPQKIALNWKAEPQFGGFYAAKESKAAKDHGLTFDVIEGGAGTPTIQMVGAGTVDFGVVSADEIVIARARGADVVGVFAVYQTNPQGFLVHDERGFKSIGDLYRADGILALQKGLAYAQFLDHKYPGGKVKTVPYSGGIGPFLADPKFSQQCFVTSEPLAAKHAGAKAHAFLIADEGFNPYTTVLAVRGDFLRKNEDLVKSVVAAVREGWDTYLKDPTATNKLMSGINKTMDETTFRESAEAQVPLIATSATKTAGLGTMTEARWRELAEQLASLKFVDKAPAAASLFHNY